jgi:hypothetical protein
MTTSHTRLRTSPIAALVNRVVPLVPLTFTLDQGMERRDIFRSGLTNVKHKGSLAHSVENSLQLRVLGSGLLQDGDVVVGVFPEREELVVASLRLGGIACHCVRTTNLKMNQ